MTTVVTDQGIEIFPSKLTFKILIDRNWFESVTYSSPALAQARADIIKSHSKKTVDVVIEFNK